MDSTTETLLALPNEVITEVYKDLDVLDFLSVRQTCRRMYEISDQASIWKLLFIRLTEGYPTGLTKMLENCPDGCLKKRVLSYVSSHGRWRSDPRPVVRYMPMKKFMSRLTGTDCDKILLPGGRWMLTRTTASDFSSIIYAHDLDAAVPTSREIMKLPTASRILSMVRIPGIVPELAKSEAPAAFYFALIGLNLSAVSLGRESIIYIFAFRPGHSTAVVHLKSLRSSYNTIDPMVGPLFQDGFLLQTVSPTTLQITNWHSLSRTESMTLVLGIPQEPLARTTRLLNSGRTLLAMQLPQREIGVQLCIYDLPEYVNGRAIRDGSQNALTMQQLKPTWVVDVPDSSGFDLHAGNLNLSGIQRSHTEPYTRLALRVCNIVYGVIVPDDTKLTPSISILSVLPGLGQVKSELITMGLNKLFISQGVSIHNSFISFSWPNANRAQLSPQYHQERHARAPWNGIAPYFGRVSIIDEVSGRVVTSFKVRTTPPRQPGTHLIEQMEDLEELRLMNPEPTWSVLDLAAPEYLPWRPEEYNVVLNVDPQ